MKLKSTKSLQEVTFTWTSPQGKQSSFKTDKCKVEFHCQQLRNNPYIKSFSFKKGS